MKLADYKRDQGLSLTALAERIGFGISTVHGWIDPNSGRRPGPSAIAQIIERTGGAVTGAELRPDLASSFQPPDPPKAVAGTLDHEVRLQTS